MPYRALASVLVAAATTCTTCGARSELEVGWGAAGAAGARSSSASGSGSANPGGSGGHGSDGGYRPGCDVELPGPALVEVSGPAGARYCIDATEVTNRHYARWLATDPAVGAQPGECAWNGSFAPTHDWPAQAERLDHPVVWVDWCDAAAYCRFAGKRLCGRIGGGNLDGADWEEPDESEWLGACTAGGEQAFPYGASYDPGACNGLDLDADGTLPVGSLESCEGGFPGLFDMVGNVDEWIRACAKGSGDMDLCISSGGSFMDGPSPSCATATSGGNKMTSLLIGIRCCRDATP